MNARIFLKTTVLACLLSPALVMAMGPGHRAENVEAEHTPKPGTPVAVSITPATAAPRPGDVAELIITLRSSIATEDAVLTIKLTGGAELLAPDAGKRASWDMSIARGESVTRSVTVRFADHPGSSVSAIVEIKAPGGGRYSARASIKAGPDEPASKPSDMGTRATDSKGRGIIEHRDD